MPACPVPIMAEREFARLEEELRRQEAQRLAQEKERAELLAQRERRRAQQTTHPASGKKPRWGTPEARWDAMMELQRRIDSSREDENEDED